MLVVMPENPPNSPGSIVIRQIAQAPARLASSELIVSIAVMALETNLADLLQAVAGRRLSTDRLPAAGIVTARSNLPPPQCSIRPTWLSNVGAQWCGVRIPGKTEFIIR